MMDSEPRDAKAHRLDLDALFGQALMEQTGEAYLLVSSGDDHRLGVVVTASPDGEPVHSIELLVRLFMGQTEPRLRSMERAAQMAKELKGRGYLLMHEDGGWISCGRTLPRGEVEAECEVLMDMVMAFRADRMTIEMGEEE